MPERLISRKAISLLTLLALVFLSPFTVEAEETDPATLTLERIFADEEFKAETFGPARWLEDGSGYTTLEESAGHEDAKEIVRYDPSTGSRVVLVAAQALRPPDRENPLPIDDYLWSDDGTHCWFSPTPRRCGGATLAVTTGCSTSPTVPSESSAATPASRP